MGNIKIAPSIFNDVIGPVMRGPSSSHCAAAVRIGKMVRSIVGEKIDHLMIEFDPKGSLATTHETQGSDMGLFAGLLGWDTTDERLVVSRKYLEAAGTNIEIKIAPINATHPNTYKLTITNELAKHSITAISTGGGAVEIIRIDEFELSIRGDCYETLIRIQKPLHEESTVLTPQLEIENIIYHGSGEKILLQIKSLKSIPEEKIYSFFPKERISLIKVISPVMPILTEKNCSVPFLTVDELLLFNNDRNFTLWELALEYESARGNISKDEVLFKMIEIIKIIHISINEGLSGTAYKNRILPNQTKKFLSAGKSGKLLDGGVLNKIILYVSAIMEVKSSMGVIVAAPTAGSCGGLPAAIFAVADSLSKDDIEIAKAMLAAGLIGILILNKSTFAAEECGCQAECGAGSGMAAAGLVALAGGSLEQSISAASMALQNIFGMTCDPVANRVEVPCLGKNVLEATNALSCANMSLAGFDAVIPLDEVIDAMDRVGRSLPMELRCTALGGLSITKTSKSIEKYFDKFSSKDNSLE